MAEENTNRLRLLEVMRVSKLEFVERLVAHSDNIPRETAKALRGEAVAQICEFYFLIDEMKIETDQQVRRLAHGHNALTEATLSDPGKMERLGKKPDALKKALFQELGIEKLIENFRRRPPCFDQSDLSRLLVTQMAPESCNRAVKHMEEAGLLESFKNPYGSKLLHSPGLIEEYYRNYLDDLGVKVRLHSVQEQ
nr:hypothetical protein [uncultured Roseibium sp.]